MNNKTKKLIATALCITLGVVLPQVFHFIPNAGQVILPMHIPVLLCGLLCGPILGMVCGLLTPLLSSFITGMPMPAFLPNMMAELLVYGLVAGIVYKLVKSRNEIANIYISLISAMILGRVVYGILNALIFSVGKYSLSIWITSLFVTAVPGIIIQLVFIPAIVFALKKAGFSKNEL